MKEKLIDFYKNNKKAVYIGSAALAVVIIGLIVLLVSCGNGKNGSKDKETGKAPSSFNVIVQSEGGMVFPKVDVYIYEDSSLSEMVAAAKTDENGKMSFDSEGASKYVAVLKGVPEGYDVKECYDVTEENTVISLKTVINPVDLDNSKLAAGNVMQELEVTTPDGETIKVSELLKEKKVVMLNFFFLACQPCKSEFPFMQEAYAAAGEDVAVIALTPVDQDDAAIKQYAEELGLTFYVAKCDSRWEQVFNISSYPTTVVLDRYGMISLVHSGSVTNSETFTAIFDFYKADTYKQQVVRFVEDILNYKGEEGTEENPIEILPDTTEFEADVKAEGKLYYEILKVTNMELTIADENAYIIYEDTTYNAVDGVVKVVISAPDTYTPAKFVIGNNAKEDKTFKATLAGVAGTMMNPFEMSIGEFVTNVEAGNEQGVYYTYTATESGTLTLKCVSTKDDVKYDITLYNLNTYANRTLSADANEDGTVSVVVNANDVVQITVSTMPDENNEYPTGEFNMEASFVPGEGTGNAGGESVEYTVKVTDNSGKAMSNVKVVIDTAEGKTDSKGEAKLTLKAGSYTVAVTAPSGYKVQGIPTVTKDETSITVVLVDANAKMVKYTVKVTDESGKAVSGATVVIGASVFTTNASGAVTAELAEGTYDVTVSANGYSVGSGSLSKSSTSVTVKLKKGGAVANGITYTVNVVDYSGKGISGVTAVFMSNGVTVGTATSDSSGKAAVQLEKGEYEVSLTGLGTLGYDNGDYTVSTDSTSVSIVVAQEGKKTSQVYDIDRYTLNLGATYVKVEKFKQYKDIPGIAVFEPTKTGKYKISVLSCSVKLSDYGSNTSFLAKQDTKIKNKSYTINVKTVGPTYLVGLDGVDGCIVVVERVGDAEYTEEDLIAMMDWTPYVGKDVLSYYSLESGQTLEQVNISAATGTYNLVYNKNDGRYHLDSEQGPLVVVKLKDAPYISIFDMIGAGDFGGTTFGNYIYENNKFVRKESYNNVLSQYISYMDSTNYVYPLTEDLKYILQGAGNHFGWWSSTNENNIIYQNNKTLNPEYAWMFCCYIVR